MVISVHRLTSLNASGNRNLAKALLDIIILNKAAFVLDGNNWILDTPNKALATRISEEVAALADEYLGTSKVHEFMADLV